MPPVFPQGPPQKISKIFASLPTEIFLQISHSFSVADLLRFACTSKAVWNAIMEPHTFHQIVRQLLLKGSLRWILPVKDAYNEVKRMHGAAIKWLSAYDTSIRAGTVVRPLTSPSFPYYPFLRQCFRSDSMMNRRRLWGIVKQFDDIWADYRLRGWQRDVFYCRNPTFTGVRPLSEMACWATDDDVAKQAGCWMCSMYVEDSADSNGSIDSDDSS
jgi:hypothetical protein